jgi:elongation of very long chain fatty acids protein 6
MRWMNAHWEVPFATVALYVAVVFWGKSYMAERKPWNWKNQLAVWNMFLSVFSTWGFLRCLPHLLHNVITMSFWDNFCVPARTTVGGGSTGLWIFLFTVSKFPELLDTFFIVIHKKKLMFLHWYHHVTVLLYCWHCYTTNSIPGIIFVTMNLGVHALMYFYYFLMAIKCKPKWFNPMIITVLQGKEQNRSEDCISPSFTRTSTHIMA